MTHYAYHVGQIVFLAKHFRTDQWKSLSIPRNRSAEFNRYLKKLRRRGTDLTRLRVLAADQTAETVSIGIVELNHVNVTVPESMEDASRNFYGSVLGLQEVPKPDESRGRGGAWYQLGNVQLHLSIEQVAGDNQASKRHVCYVVRDLSLAEERFREAGVEIIPDEQPVTGWRRFYVRDPGGNRIEIAQRSEG